jgi:ATP-dependent DNA helicase RecQ
LQGKYSLYGFEVEDKLFSNRANSKEKSSILNNLCSKQKILYQISSQLQSLGFKATYYHGGLSREKDKNMQLWMEDKSGVLPQMHLGWGLTKADVKTVIHIQLPENLESTTRKQDDLVEMEKSICRSTNKPFRY